MRDIKCLLFFQFSFYISDSVIQEQTELVTNLPVIQAGRASYYTPPYLNSVFPQITDKQTIPKIHVSGMLPNVNTHSEADVASLQWSQPIDLLLAADNFVSLPGVADVKVHVQQVAMVTHVTIAPITKADVSAKEIRSRLKGRDRTITISQQTEIKDTSANADLKENIFAAVANNETESGSTSKKKEQKTADGKSCTKLSFGVLVNQVTFVVLDETSSVPAKNEIIRLTIDDLFFAMYPASQLVEQPGYSRNCFVFSLGDVQLDNQVQSSGNFDFPVVFIKQNFDKPSDGKNFMQISEMNVLEKHAVLKSTSLIHVQVVYGNLNGRNSVIESVDCTVKPVNFYIDDTFVFQCIKEVGTFLPVPLSTEEPLPVSVLKLPPRLKNVSKTLSCPVVIGHLSIQALSVLFSIHASLKIFIASDHTPLSFGKFEKMYLCTSSYQLIRLLTMHYASGALFRAGM